MSFLNETHKIKFLYKDKNSRDFSNITTIFLFLLVKKEGIKMTKLILIPLLLAWAAYTDAQETKIDTSGEKIVLQGKSYHLHTVKPKETLFSICKAYGVNLDEVRTLNGKNDNTLAIGEVLRLPVVEPFKPLDDKFYYHRVQPKETLYSISRKFGIKIKRILKDNPDCDVSRPLARGAVVKLNLKQIDRNVLEAELRWIERRERETRESERETERQQRENERQQPATPARDSLREILRQPVKDTLLPPPDEPREAGHLKVALLLPLCVKDNKLPDSIEEIPVDTLGVNLRDERWRLNARSEPFLQFYQGVLMAADSLKHLGYTIDLNVYDTGRDAERTRLLAGELNRLNPDLIIGPVYSNTYKALAEQIANRSIPMIYPLSSRGRDIAPYPNAVQMNISPAALVEEMAAWIAANSAGVHLINILPDGGRNGGEESRLPALVRERLRANGTETMTDLRWHARMRLDTLRRIMKPQVENIILFPSVDEAAASRTLPVLSALTDHFRITVIGFPEWLKFTAVDDEVFYKLNLKIFTNSYVDHRAENARTFSARHREYFHAEPGNLANRAFDMCMYFLPLVNTERANTLNTLREKDRDGLFTRFRLRPATGAAGLENRGLYLVNYNRGFEIIVTPVPDPAKSR